MAGGSFDPKAMGLMLDVMNRHGLEVPASMTILSRALLTLEGTLRTIEPSFNIATEVNELLPGMAGPGRRDEGSAREGGAARASRRCAPCPGTRRASPSSSATDVSASGSIGSPGLTARSSDGWVDRVTFAAIGVFGLLSSSVLLLASGIVADDQDGVRNTLQLLGFLGLIVSSTMQMRSVAHLLRSRTGTDDDHQV